MIVKFTVYGLPTGKGRPRVTRHGTYTPKKTKEFEDLVRLSWKSQSGKAFTAKVPLMARIVSYFPVPKSVSKKKAETMAGTFHVNRPDADNLAKAILDSLNGLAYPDDAAVQIDRSWKVYTNAAPRVEVEIEAACRLPDASQGKEADNERV